MEEIFQLEFFTKDGLELQNMVMLAKLIVSSCLERKESRGGHFRLDYPMKNDSDWRRHITWTKDSKRRDGDAYFGSCRSAMG